MARIEGFDLKKTGPIGHSEIVNYGHDVKLPRFMSLREPVQYENIQDFAEQAAIEDQASGSLDKYIFNGDGKKISGEYQTPFEANLEEIMLVERNRVSDLGRRDITAAVAHRANLDSQRIRIEKDLRAKSQKLQSANESLLREVAILEGNSLGSDDIKRPGALLQTTGFQGWLNAYKNVLIIIFVSVVDASVLFMSLATLFGNGLEGLFFAIPAIGVQIMFPHFIGAKMALARDSKKGRKLNAGIAIFLTIAWAIFIAAVSTLRTIYFKQQLTAEGQQDDLQMKLSLTQIFIPIVLVGLGLWLILEALSFNPHQPSYVRAARLKQVLVKKISRKEGELEVAAGKVAAQDVAISNLDKSIADHEKAVRELFPSVAKKWYRRTLVNQAGDPNFTSEATK